VDNSRDESFKIQRDGIKVLGGYPSGGGTRDPDANTVTLSGDIDADDGGADDPFAPNTDTDGDASTPTQTDHIRGSNAYHVVEMGDAGASITGATVFEGLVITAGLSDNSYPNNLGGGLYCDATTSTGQCSPTMRDVVFRGNASNYGGALALDVEAPSGSSGQAAPVLSNVFFRGNAALSFWGGAVYIFVDTDGSASPSFRSTVFRNNVAATRGGAVYNASRNGTAAEPSFTNVVFLGNLSDSGGAIYNSGLDTGSKSTPTITNAVFTDNGANFDGGAIYNQADSDGLSNPQIVNSILWGNINDADQDGSTRGGPEIFNNRSGAQPAVEHSIVENGGSTGIVDDNGASTSYDTATNLESDPQFVDPTDPDGFDDEFGTSDDGLRLRGLSFSTPSPAIDAGTNAALDTDNDGNRDITTDLVGNDRVLERDGDGTATVDIGPYEYDGDTLPVELTALEATASSDGVALEWRTASEQNNAGFRVQRRVVDARAPGARRVADGASEDWSRVGRVDGSGTTSSPQTYRFTDDTLPAGADTLQYRLAQVDLDGTVNLSDPVTVGRGGPSGVKLLDPYPNPARTRATVSLAVPEQASGDATLRLYDVLGRQVRTVDGAVEPGRSTATVDVSGLPSGVYVLRLAADGTTRTRRLTVVK
jgi:predicted outer membrane repeat protein